MGHPPRKPLRARLAGQFALIDSRKNATFALEAFIEAAERAHRHECLCYYWANCPAAGDYDRQTLRQLNPKVGKMEIHFSAELQGKLRGLARKQGRETEALVVEAVERMVEYEE